MGLIGSIIIGVLAGFLAGKIMHGHGFGFWINLIISVVGGLLGGWVFSLLGISSHSTLGTLIMAIVGSCLLLFLWGLISKKRK